MRAKAMIMGDAVGYIIATIITIHSAMKTGALMPIVRLMSSDISVLCQMRMDQDAADSASREPRISPRSVDSRSVLVASVTVLNRSS